MKLHPLVGYVAGLLLLVACFLPWVTIESRGVVVSGMDAGGTSFGKPGSGHLFFLFFYFLFLIVPRVWAKRANLVVVALNAAWCLRNFLIIGTCSGGICPERSFGFYLLLIASLLMLVAALFTEMKPAGRRAG